MQLRHAVFVTNKCNMVEGLDNNRERIVKVFLNSLSAKLKFSLVLKNEQYSAIDSCLTKTTFYRYYQRDTEKALFIKF